MKHLTIVALLLGGLCASHTYAVAADASRGARLHGEQCVTCHAARFGNHGNDIYTRADRRVQSLHGLQQQVNRCKNNLQIVWFDEDVNDVVDHLNTTHYRFPQN
ncbi:MAG: cytochrome c [Gammaproteobacteria bacterium]|nr:cytochrome c [Gammaproteobacteria bacterium]